MDLKGKTAVVTGGAAGIGLDTCRRLVKEGCSVTLWDVDAAGLARVGRSFPEVAQRCSPTPAT